MMMVIILLVMLPLQRLVSLVSVSIGIDLLVKFCIGRVIRVTPEYQRQQC